MNYQNLTQLFEFQTQRLGPRTALRYQKHGLYHDLSWSEYYHSSMACAASLVEAGVVPGDRVGLLAENRVEWLIADMGILAAGAVNVPPHAPLTARQVQYQLADAGVCWLFVSTAEQLGKIRSIRAELPNLRGVVGFDGRSEDCPSWAGFLQRGRQLLPRLREELARRTAGLERDSLATIMYTSGTTGDPKGVMLTHGNLLSNALSVNEAYPRSANSVLLNWLPFSHIYARTVDHYLSIVAGVVLCLAESAETVIENLAQVKPTHMSCVPRFYEKVLAAVASDDPVVTKKKLRHIFGRRLEWLTSGGAPLPIGVARAFQEAGLLILQGYGLTECAPVISFNQPDSYKLETVGRAVPGVEIRIAADGEVLTRGPHVMPGYWNNPEASAAAVRDGWLYTGDLGRLDDDGFLTITGRKKEILVLSSGKNVAPTVVEGMLLTDPCIDQAIVFGDGKNFLTALIAPHWDHLRQALVTAGITASGENAHLAADEQVLTFLQQRIDNLLQDLANWERVKKIAILAHPLTLAAEELTVSLKLRRSVIYEKHQEQVEAMYC